MHFLDWLVMALYAAVVVTIGVLATIWQRDSEDYFLGGRRIPWLLAGVSLVATSFSSVSLIGGTGFGYARGLAWLQLQIGDLLAIVIVMAVFLPFFSRLGLTTAYEYLEERFGVVARTAASSLFILQTLLRASILVYTPALALATVTGCPVDIAILLSAAAAILYSAFGGIGAVVWTDLIQFTVILFAVGFCLVLVVSDVPGGLEDILRHASETDRLEVVTVSADPKSIMNVLGTLVPYAVLALSLFGTGQQAVQRFLSCRSLNSARLAALTGWGAGTMALGLTLLLGVFLAAWADLAPVAAGFAQDAGDRVLPAFITWRLPVGFAGLLLAAVFAASMSSMDSAIHSMSTATIVDFVRRFSPTRPGPRDELLIARLATVAFGLTATSGALYAARLDTPILETLVTWLGYFAGPLLGLFLLGMLTKTANEVGALLGVGTAFLGVVLMVAFRVPAECGFHPLWLAPSSCVYAFLMGCFATWLSRM